MSGRPGFETHDSRDVGDSVSRTGGRPMVLTNRGLTRFRS